ncbi:MAG: hypothetical protein GXO50_00905 [Chlorobi bacterium]|nr:hypothetical protein [Chlorobiota bacterium]
MKLKLLILFFTLSNNIQAQFLKNDICGYSGINAVNRQKDFYRFYKSFSKSKNIKYNIPVKFKIIRTDNGKSKITPAYLKELIKYLNYYYLKNNTGIQFSLHPDYSYIDKSKLLQLRYYTSSPLQSMKFKKDACINVIITSKLIKKKPFGIKRNEYAGTFNPVSRSIIIAGKIPTSTLSHEIGHYLGLKHPHRGWKHKWFQEPVSRTRKTFLGNKLMCEKKGDGLCDTPAEPDLTKYTDKKCRYTGWNVKDKYGEVYKPNTNNIMSYTNNRECRNKFTEQQTALMHYTLSKNKYAKLWRTDIPENKDYIPDDFEPDNHKETANEIFFDTPQTHSFHHTTSLKHKKDIPDKKDWIFFNLKTKKQQTVKLIFSNKNKFNPNIKISISKDSKLLAEKILFKNNLTTDRIIIPNAKPGKYYIKAEHIIDTKQETFYKITLTK